MQTGAEDPRPVSVRRRTEPSRGGADDPPPQAPAETRRMLLVHGLAANDSVWDACLGLLPADHEVWTARLPWRGENMAAWGQDPDLTARLDEALRKVPGGPDVVVAHSMSANVLLELLDRSGRQGVDPFAHYGIGSLVLVAPFYRRSAEDFDWNALSYYVNDFHLIMEEGVRAHSAGRFAPEIQRAMGQRVRDRVGPYGWLRFFEMYLRTPQLRTSEIAVPCLVLGGDTDFAAPPREGEALAAALPDARFRLLPGSGHFPMIEEAERFASEIGAFVNSSADAGRLRGPDVLSTLEPQA
ncbi:alpha/beta fold hydrolase [Streptomyces sp. TP-A0874]|uniref:alpha/beta fold hydrolase n=1 Tax=Streptomyces sp. TP-A0874 TaxID=549819 RepID=UPI000AA68FB9|nr:alpha/beta hydrolase [Streptomyces sp. TP-A0874]